MHQRLCSERRVQSGTWEFSGCFLAITEHRDSSGSLLTCRFLGPAHRDDDSVDMVQGGARNLCLKNTLLPQIPKGTTIQRETKIQARREGKHRPRNESKLHPRVRLELLASSFWAKGLSLPSWLSGLPMPRSQPAVYPGLEPLTSPRREMFQVSQARQGLQLTGFNWIMYLSICNALSSLKSTCPHCEALPSLQRTLQGALTLITFHQLPCKGAPHQPWAAEKTESGVSGPRAPVSWPWLELMNLQLNSHSLLIRGPWRIRHWPEVPPTSEDQNCSPLMEKLPQSWVGTSPHPPPPPPRHLS